ncbi:D-alanyl-D-alanine carboxypeptidase family protein [Microbacterium sp. SORGH_AS_0862]|uniref:D-alanyl-D-alanine carboxypeptidase family protein n=1 Tax=Microbacterium sp. SORGH_AS_0862 TaxID=3041789 RepID=UPI0027915B68|nr:D-alanyl-D-alanine carboxypeptidase family protein [Microbacterium sp. SORGH_AS_0862]MDQ1205025.1 hypothetical protein [Microbacterium sp. SORGH_AS_0862]
MATYRNGEIPLAVMVKLGDTWYLPPGAAARWQWIVRAAKEKYGVMLRPSSGWTCYRPVVEQQAAWDARLAYLAGGAFAASAAYPRTSNHGTGNAIDVANWRDLAPGNEALAWARFTALCRLAGFVTGLVSGEPWHITLQADPWVIPAGLEVTPITTTVPKEDDDMRAIRKAGVPDSGIIIQSGVPPYSLPDQIYDALRGAYGLADVELADWQYDTVRREHWAAFDVVQRFASKEATLAQAEVVKVADATRDAIRTSFPAAVG